MTKWMILFIRIMPFGLYVLGRLQGIVTERRRRKYEYYQTKLKQLQAANRRPRNHSELVELLHKRKF